MKSAHGDQDLVSQLTLCDGDMTWYVAMKPQLKKEVEELFHLFDKYPDLIGNIISNCKLVGLYSVGCKEYVTADSIVTQVYKSLQASNNMTDLPIGTAQTINSITRVLTYSSPTARPVLEDYLDECYANASKLASPEVFIIGSSASDRDII